ncbi:lysoplasmalogenase [Sphingomonas sp. ID1715]|uniref:lysoplasmalogenase family protein n=1 Tax=Sphingomonas sp. ID1715 TaxID=1656898 RepID=UPI001487EEE9|nr:lysoplasmalogenase family protein [Sphingomonas sp. ID1715]NNM77930.1 lysoplasmalogenase [Sphingomonas sp. ID1715]
MRALFWAAVIAGSSYWPASHLGLPPAVIVAWKGSGVALLAFWAASQARLADGWLLALVLALGTAGDVLLEVAGLQLGAVAFLAAHCVATALYLRHRRQKAGWWPVLAIPVVVVVAAALPADRSAAPGIALYSFGLAAMAVAAILSRFSLAAIGAWLFVGSDLLIFARLGPLAGSWLPTLLVWPLYFLGQALIAWGVVRGLEQERENGGAGLHHRL